MQRTMTYLFVFTLIFSGLLTPAAPAVFASDTAVQETPTPLIFSGVTRYTLTAPKLFWYSGVPDCPPKIAAAATAPTASAGQYTELIRRMATYGSSTRTLYSESRDCNQNQMLSNMVADADYLYWLGSQGLMRLSTNANPGDQPELVNALVKAPGEVADGGDRVYVISNNTGGSNTEIAYVRKDNKQEVPLSTPGNSADNLSSDGQSIYYKVNSTLIRLQPGVDSGIVIANKVAGYYAEGRRLRFCTINPFKCFFSNNVYIGIGNQIFIYDNNTNTLGASPIYTSSDTSALIDSLVTDFSKLFFYEARTDACGDLFCNQSYVLMRTARSGGTADALYTFGPTVSAGPSHLTTDGTYLFWQENESVQRLANDAAALPQINLRVTGIEVTQGIQNTSNSVLLVKNRRTFVRLYVKSDGAAVSGVGAALAAPVLESSVQPVNPVGTHLTVRTNPNRNDINQSFLFELPWNWTQQDSLVLHATLNPYKIPLEPNYGDNDTSITLNFKPSPSLSVEFFRLNYTIGGTTYRPRISEDVLKTYSWIMRAYPLGGAVGTNFKPRLWDVDGGTRLGNWVNRSSGDCTKSKIHDSDLNLCASYYTNGWLWYYRIATLFGTLNVGLNPHSFYYGMISDASKNFPRGQAAYPLTSVGPAGTPGQFFSLGQGWDTDGSYADWYAGHEIGHSLGRAHPSASAALCGNSASDPGYPYPNGQIGPNDGSMEGFDVGDPAFGIAKAVYPGTQWYDVMSYCSNQWISDYTYKGMFDYMSAHPSAAVAAATTQSPAVTGDFLAVAGVISPTADLAGLTFVRRLDSVVNQPALVPGDYSIRLLDAQNHILADYAFTPTPMDDNNGLGFGQVVNFVAGTRSLQIVKTNGGQILTSMAVSANPPVVSNVALQGATNPVTGTVTLNWNASDPDNDPLTFDIAYSRDNGATFQPVMINVTGNSAQIDTAQLGGSGTAILRVTASDGVNSAGANSAPFVMANKPPQPYILTPGENTHVHFGQLVNFSGMALDAQDGTVDSSGLVWKNAQGETLGNGALLSLDNLPVGSNVITLVATNSVGESASATVTVLVDDDLNLPGPTLTAGPSPIHWHVASGTTQTQTTDVTISNAGSGALDWQASSDQSWLTLSAASGTIASDGDPATLTLSANSSGLAAAATHLAHVTIVTPASGNTLTQTVTIPVSLSIGDVWTVPAQTGSSSANQAVYLPVIVR